MFFMTIEKGYENLQHKVCIFCAETVKKFVQLLLTVFFYVEDCMAANGNISMFFKERAATSEKISMCHCF